MLFLRLCCLAVLLLGCGCSQPPARPNLLFIAVDTLRADRAADPRLMPRVARLAREGVVFEQAFAHAPWTLPSFASMFSGQLPPQHGAGGDPSHRSGLWPTSSALTDPAASAPTPWAPKSPWENNTP